MALGDKEDTKRQGSYPTKRALIRVTSQTHMAAFLQSFTVSVSVGPNRYWFIQGDNSGSTAELKQSL